MTTATTVVLDNSLNHDDPGYLFTAPVEVIRCDRIDQVSSAIARIESACEAGMYAAGFFAYELGYALEPRLRPLMPFQRRYPLIWVGIFRAPSRLGKRAVDRWLAEQAPGSAATRVTGTSMSRTAYLDALARVQAYITAGDLYQVNLAFKQQLHIKGNPLALYRQLRSRQPVAHGGLIRAPGFHVLSLSPELFVRMKNDKVVMRPMKGTARRGVNAAADTANRHFLHEDPKNRAENLMIVDLMRNDMGRIADLGSVHVANLFTIETYPTLHQMTSTVCGRLRSNVSLFELLQSLFPCGSITGAPKIRAMEVIRELETQPRGVYTGSLGFIGPNRQIQLNVAIRTLFVDNSGHGEMGIGSGVVADSKSSDEYEECLLKARFLDSTGAHVATTP